MEKIIFWDSSTWDLPCTMILIPVEVLMGGTVRLEGYRDATVDGIIVKVGMKIRMSRQ